MESTVRSRPSRSKNAKGEKKIEAENKPEENDSSWMLSRSYLLYVLMPLIVLAVSAGLTLYAARTSSSPKAPKESRKDAKLTLFTEDELAKHDGSDPSLPIYIVVLGRVYDVEKGRKHYAPESGYNVFAGRDSTPSFVTGVFSREEATDDVSALSPEEMMGVKDWMDFYRKDYTYVGRLVGRYYDSHGEPTPALLQARQKIKEGQRLRKLQEGENKRFPGCNSRWSQDEGSTVWCTNESAGVRRDWAGVPRKYFKPGKTDYKCVCIRTTGPASDTGTGDDGDLNNPSFRLYSGCGKLQASCKVKS